MTQKTKKLVFDKVIPSECIKNAPMILLKCLLLYHNDPGGNRAFPRYFSLSALMDYYQLVK